MIKGETLLLPGWELQLLWSVSSESAQKNLPTPGVKTQSPKPHTDTNVPGKQIAEASQHSSGICPHVQKLNELL